MMRAALIAVLALALVSAASGQPPPERIPTPAQEDASMHGYGDSDITCREWTDGCRTCTRSDAGDPVCPNIGIACQPKPITCVRRTDSTK